MEYQVELESFRGPLDLLLYLVKHHEVDVVDLPIAQITEQFLEYLKVIQQLDVDWAGEFLVMAATLTEIKSRMVLLRAEIEATEESDPRLELVRQLVEYKKFKDAAALLEAEAEKQQSRLARQPIEIAAATRNPEQQPLRPVELWDLVSAFGRLMRETQATQPQQIVFDDTPLHVHMESILAIVASSPFVTLNEIFLQPRTCGRLVGIFLALLELIKGGKVAIDQAEPFGEIVISICV